MVEKGYRNYTKRCKNGTQKVEKQYENGTKTLLIRFQNGIKTVQNMTKLYQKGSSRYDGTKTVLKRYQNGTKSNNTKMVRKPYRKGNKSVSKWFKNVSKKVTTKRNKMEPKTIPNLYKNGT